MKYRILLTILISLTCVNLINSQVPEKFSYQGYLTDIDGIVVEDGSYEITFNLYNSKSGGVSLWSEVQTIDVENGIITVVLGNINPISIDFMHPIWLGITINNNTELTPRIEMTSVPYSFMAKSVMKDAIGSFSIADNSILLKKINIDNAKNGDIIKFNGDSLVWSNDLVGGGGNFTLPFKQEVDFFNNAFWIIQKGAGTIGVFDIENPGAGGYALKTSSNAALPSIFTKNSNMIETGANAIYGLSEGIAPTAKFINSGNGSAGLFETVNNKTHQSTIIVNNNGLGSAAEIISSNIKNKDTTLKVYNKGLGITANFLSKQGNKAVINAVCQGGGANVANFLQQGAGNCVKITVNNSNNLRPALSVTSNSQEYSGSLAYFKMTGTAGGVMIDIVNNANERSALGIRHIGKGTGLSIVTEKTTAKLDKGINSRASLFVESRSPNKAPATLFRGTDSFKGDLLVLEQRGQGKTLNINNFVEDNAQVVSISDSGKGKSLRVIKNNEGYAGYFHRTVNDTTPVIYASALYGSGPAVKGEGALYGGYFAIYTNSGTGAALTAKAHGLNNRAIQTKGNIEINDGSLYLDGNININNSSTVLGSDLQLTGQIQAQGAISGNSLHITNGGGFGGNVQINGDLTVNGNLTKAGGSFKIDHPLFPEQKYLYHSFVESPDMKNIYDGIAVLDKNGEAIVILPKWFQALNRDFRYQLTCLGDFANVYIAEEIKNNSFKISGGYKGLKVSWQITGIRHDAYANKHRIPVEEEKLKHEIGFYLHPDAFGLPTIKSISNAKK